MANPETEFHELLDVINEAACHGDVTNVLRLGDLAEEVRATAVEQGYLPARTYRANEAMIRTLVSVTTKE